ncbi:MAG TPA: hypothetical protein VM658_16955 [bacterium]|nr:hypothetical protein [bacterium]
MDPLLAKDTATFYDDCHFNVSGSEKVAQNLADFMAPLIEADK